MKLSWKVRVILLVVLVVQIVAGAAQLTANSESAEKCITNSAGGCNNNGCGGVCGQPVVAFADGSSVAVDDCWCL